MSDSMLQPHNEITGLVPVNHHQREDARKFQKRKKNEKDNPHPDIPEEAVEDLLQHTEDEEDAPAPVNELARAAETDESRDHLDMLL